MRGKKSRRSRSLLDRRTKNGRTLNNLSREALEAVSSERCKEATNIIKKMRRQAKTADEKTYVRRTNMLISSIACGIPKSRRR